MTTKRLPLSFLLHHREVERRHEEARARLDAIFRLASGRYITSARAREALRRIAKLATPSDEDDER